ncbi:MAG TPA: winged helix-turn-helix domain-containing protein [Blastocatellia bacterium]|nr:winged helix-turn-helix domain-containing protein [Blastocatellia bacterium]
MSSHDIKVNSHTLDLEPALFYEFGPFRLDATRRLLLREGKPVPLTYKAFETLAILVQNSGRVIEKDELMREVWPDTFVEEGSLARNISVLRKALGEGPSDHHYIETIPKRGYRFVARVREVIGSKGHDVAAADSIEMVGPEGDALEPAPLAGGIEYRDDIRGEPASTALPAPSLGGLKTPRNYAAWSVAAAIVLAALAILAVQLTRTVPQPLPGEAMKVTRFTTNAKSLDGAISPDGKYVVYAMMEEGKQSLWVKQVATSSNVQIVPAADVSYQGLAFSPDGNYVFFNMWDRKSVGAIYKVPALGGVPTKIITDVMPSLAVSPDGRQIAFVRGLAAEKAQALMVAGVDGGDARELSRREATEWYMRPAWSPDGKTIACGAASRGHQGVSTVQIVELPAEGGPERLISSQKWLGLGGIVWLKDGSGLILMATDHLQTPLQIWTISYKDGVARKVTSDVNGYYGLSATEDGKTLVTVQEDVLSNLWVMPGANTAQARKVTSGKYEGFSFCWTPDNRIVFKSWASGSADLWIMDQDGRNKKQLTSDPSEDAYPQVTPDGRYIIFISNRSGAFNIWRMNIDGSNLKQLTHGQGEWAVSFSAAENSIVYVGSDSGKQTLWKLSLDGETPQQLTKKYSYSPAVSPDGKLIAYSYWDEEATPQQWGREIISIKDGQRVKSFTIPDSALINSGDVLLRWMPDGRALTYIDRAGGVANIWSLPLDGGEPKPLTDFKDDQIFWFEWTREGGTLACARGIVSSDVVLINNFR